MVFERDSDQNEINNLKKQIEEIVDNQIFSTGDGELHTTSGTLGRRNSAEGTAQMLRGNNPRIHHLTDKDEAGAPTGTFDRINLVSTLIIIDHTSTPMSLKFINGKPVPGTTIRVTPKSGKALTIETAGDFDITSPISLIDDEYVDFVFFSEAETGISGGGFKTNKGDSGSSSPSPPFIDSDPLVRGSSDATKLLRFEIDGFSTLTTRVITIPNASVTMAGLGVVSQTWTGTNIFTGPVAIRDTSFFIQNTSDITKQMNFALAGATTGQVVTITSNHTANRTITLPNLTTTLAGLGVTQSWTGANTFVGSVAVRTAQFFIQNTSDITKQLNFALAGASTGQVMTIASSHTLNRTVTLPNATTTLAGLVVTTQTWTGINLFNGVTSFGGRISGDITPSTTNLYDVGDITHKFNTEWLQLSLNLFGSFSGGGTPGFDTAQAKLFNRFNGTKYELRVLFPSGISQLIATEP